MEKGNSTQHFNTSQHLNTSWDTEGAALFTWMGSRGSVGGRGSGVCEFWYMGGGVGEMIGTSKQSKKRFVRSVGGKKRGKCPLYLF